MQPLERLTNEHIQIKSMIQVAMQVCDHLEEGLVVDPQHLQTIIEFIRGYADSYHHAKEEDILFPLMEQAGIPVEGGPIGVMLSDHVQGRALVAGMDSALKGIIDNDPQAGPVFITETRSYGALLAPHIFKEDNILYPMAQSILSPEQQIELIERFEQVEKERSADGEHFLTQLRKLQEIYPG